MDKRTLTLLIVNTATVVIHTVFGLMSLGNVFPPVTAELSQRERRKCLENYYKMPNIH